MRGDLWYNFVGRDIFVTPGNEDLCGKIDFELQAKILSKVNISQKLKYA